jgi:anti-sigma factor RsiW
MNAHVLEQLSAYLDGELGREESAAVQGHLSACAACAQRLEELAALDDVARALPADAPPGYFEELPARVRARLEARQRVPRWPVWSWAAAAVLRLAVQ